MFDEIRNAAGVRGDDGEAGRESLNDRDRHVIDIRTIEEDIRVPVDAAHVLGPYLAKEGDVAQPVAKDARLQRGPLGAVACEDQDSVANILLD